MKPTGSHEGLFQGHGADTNRADHACTSKLMADGVRAPCTQGARGFSCAVPGLFAHACLWPFAKDTLAYG